jgi:hypothetical protein
MVYIVSLSHCRQVHENLKNFNLMRYPRAIGRVIMEIMSDVSEIDKGRESLRNAGY